MTLRAADLASLAVPVLAGATVCWWRHERGVRASRADLARRLHDGPLHGLHTLRLSLGATPDPDVERGLIDLARELRELTEELRAPRPLLAFHQP